MNFPKLTINMQMSARYFSSLGHQAIILINVARKLTLR